MLAGVASQEQPRVGQHRTTHSRRVGSEGAKKTCREAALLSCRRTHPVSDTGQNFQTKTDKIEACAKLRTAPASAGARLCPR
eukprot:872577-Rhodomonas_salina.1